MTLHAKIRLSNILMVLVPVAVSLGSVFLIAMTSMGVYWEVLETMYRNENGIQTAQSLIYTYKKELWEYDWNEAEFAPGEDLTNLERTLADMGYLIRVEMNGEEVYSTVPEADLEAARETAGTALDTAKTLAASLGDVAVVKYTFYQDGNVCSVIAVNNDRADEAAGASYLRSYILKYVLLFAALFAGMVLFLNLALSRWISGCVLRPLKALSSGAQKIRDGNLDDAILYDRKDEFGEVCRDFNEMREYLKQSVKQRLEFEQRRRELITGVSHDLRTPLTSIKGYLDGLTDGIANTPEKRERYLRAIRIRTADLERLVESLSVYNRLENPDFVYQREPGDLRLFVEQYLADNREQLCGSQVTVRFDCLQEACPARLDGGEWKRVLDNLFTNTVRYRQKDASQIVISLRRLTEGYELVFADDGPGVPEESLPLLFDSFYRTDEARVSSGEGSGIGLAVVKKIVNGHGGSVHAENRGGLAIVITLPL